jgi:hypothetical protein
MTTATITSKTDELLQRLAEGVAHLTTTDEWLRYLDVQRRFHRYSFGNCLLIAMQRPDATQVAGFRRWLELGRQVRRGEKGIAILPPIVSRVKVLDDDSGEERTLIGAPRAFRAVHVFDVSQTDGAALPDAPVHRLAGDDPTDAYTRLVDVAHLIGFTVEEDYLDGSRNGDCNFTERSIRVEVRNDPVQQVKTLDAAHRKCIEALIEIAPPLSLPILPSQPVDHLFPSTLNTCPDAPARPAVAAIDPRLPGVAETRPLTAP